MIKIVCSYTTFTLALLTLSTDTLFFSTHAFLYMQIKGQTTEQVPLNTF